MLTPTELPALQGILKDLGLDGWLIFFFQNTNPVAAEVLPLRGMVTRRHLAFVPRDGSPVAIVNAVEPGAWRDWPNGWVSRRYTGWQELESEIKSLVAGKRVAMEYWPGNGVPYLDRVPAGVFELVRAAGADVVPSADIVTRFCSAWSPDDLSSHLRSASILEELGPAAISRAGERADSSKPITEYELQGWIIERMSRAGLMTEAPPIVAAGPNGAEVHYVPSPESSRLIERGDVLLVDLWAKDPQGPYADQTWMGVLGTPSSRVIEVWEAVRDARDAAIGLLHSRAGGGPPLRGREVHDEARRVIGERGFASFAIGRTGHSIDRHSLHGSGPNIDGLETKDDRVLLPGVAFSVEPGIYIEGEFGMRSEVNAYLGPGEVLVTPKDHQQDLIVV